MGSEGLIESDGVCDVENTVFVAVGKNVKETKSILLWAVEYFAGKKLCLLHIHQPAHFLAFIGEKLSASKLKEQAIKAYRELEWQKMHKLLNQYLLILDQAGAGKMWIEMEEVEKGIVQILSHRDIKWLVMGAAAEKQYSKNLSELKSKKAIYVCRKAPASCQIWFACKGLLICSRPANVTSQIERIEAFPSKPSTQGTSLQRSNLAHADEKDEDIQSQEYITSSTDEVVDTLNAIPSVMDETEGDDSPFPSNHKFHELLSQTSSATLLEEGPKGQGSGDLYHKLEQATILAENSRQEAFKESVRRWKAEEDAMEALRKAEAATSTCMKETTQRKELEELLDKQRQELEKMRNQHDRCIKELQMVREQMPELENRITKSQYGEKELEEKIIEAVELLILFKDKRDELKKEHEDAIREVNKLRNLIGRDRKDLSSPQFFLISFLEINEATRNFDPSWKIGEGKSGCIYKGLLRHVKVAIKMFPSHGSQSDLQFENEAVALSRVRHPNLVQLVGICPESRSLIYEYCENGSLEDRLMYQGKNHPLPWHSRVRMAIEICSALIFLHSNNPCIVHGNLKLKNILLDANYVSKIGDMGKFRLIARDAGTMYSNKLCNKLGPEASIYMDPEFEESGQITAESDVYSFGIVLLQLLTGTQTLGIVKDVTCALENGNFRTVLDLSAGNWPLELAEQLAYIALRCCKKKRIDRSNLSSDVWTLIQPMRNICTSSSLASEGKRRVPSHFVCPIFQEVMKDPYIAADGFTYESDAIKGWLNSGHKTSPMTNLKLDHCDLLPNYALYYAIQEWKQQS